MAAPDNPDWSTTIARPSTVAVGSPWAYGSGVSSANFALALDCHALGIALPGHANLTEVTVTGVTTGTVYLDTALATGSIPSTLLVPVFAALDPSVTVAINAASSGTAYLTQIYDPQVVTADLSLTNNQVSLVSVGANVLVPVDLLKSGIAPWLGANKAPVSIDTGVVANNGVFNILPAVPTHTYYLHTVYLYPTSGVADYQLQDTAGNGLAKSDLGPIGTPNNVFIPPHPPMPFNGAPLITGHGLQMVNLTGGNASWFGYCSYSLV